MKNFYIRRAPDDGTGAAGGGGGAGGAGGGNAAVLNGGGGAAGAGGGAGGAGGGAAPPAPYYSDLIGKDGTINHASFERLPENLKHLGPSLGNIKTTDDLFSKMANLNSLAGRKALAPLPANATAEDIAAQQAVIRAVQNVPEKPDGYGFKRPDDLPEEAWDANHATAAAALLHKHNAPPALAKELLSLQSTMVKAQMAAQEKYSQDWFAGQDNQFREALKADGLDYDKTMTLVGQVAAKYGIPAEAPILRNAQVRLLLKQVAGSIGEARFVGGDGSNAGLKSDQALAEDIVHNKQNPDYVAYWDAGHAKNGEVKKRVEALFASAARAQAAAGGRR